MCYHWVGLLETSLRMVRWRERETGYLRGEATPEKHDKQVSKLNHP